MLTHSTGSTGISLGKLFMYILEKEPYRLPRLTHDRATTTISDTACTVRLTTTTRPESAPTFFSADRYYDYVARLTYGTGAGTRIEALTSFSWLELELEAIKSNLTARTHA
jgi:hypothetical protein